MAIHSANMCWASDALRSTQDRKQVKHTVLLGRAHSLVRSRETMEAGRGGMSGKARPHRRCRIRAQGPKFPLERQLDVGRGLCSSFQLSWAPPEAEAMAWQRWEGACGPRLLHNQAHSPKCHAQA